MRKHHRLSLLMALAMVLTTTAAVQAQSASEATHSTTDVLWFADTTTPVGTSHLVRASDGVTATFRTTGLMAREALTLWWVVFNNPDACTAPCGEDDIFIGGDPAAGVNLDGVAAADIVVGYAGGTVTTRHGSAQMTVAVGAGDAVSEVLFGATPLLKDATRAEIHLVARSHGPVVHGAAKTQTGSYAGGCETFYHPPAVPNAVGECADIQFAVHLP